jgi:ParD-like antitoxin of type II ParDE toxin-antitoxin system
MPKNIPPIVADDFAAFIGGSGGQCRSAKVEALRVALIEGEESGASTRFDFDAFIDRKRRGGVRRPTSPSVPE